MSTFKVDVDDIREFNFSRAVPSPFGDRARNGMRFHIVTDGGELPVYHVTPRRRGRAWWVEIDEIDGSGQAARWSAIESTARELLAGSQRLDPLDFDLVIDLPTIR